MTAPGYPQESTHDGISIENRMDFHNRNCPFNGSWLIEVDHFHLEGR